MMNDELKMLVEMEIVVEVIEVSEGDIEKVLRNIELPALEI